jgi:hypothetical protein
MHWTLTARLRRCKQARSVWKSLNYPVFVPQADPEIVSLLMQRDIDGLAALLKKRASLGSGSAAALLGYLELMKAFSGRHDPNVVIAGCTAAAQRGDPYARYILSWAYWEARNGNDALHWMRRSAVESQFLPAWVDLGRMLSEVAHNAAEFRAAVKILWGAHRRGHVGALAVICDLGRRGRLGGLTNVLVLMLYPYALIRGVLTLRCDPFGIRCFSYVPNAREPLFRVAQAEPHADARPGQNSPGGFDRR